MLQIENAIRQEGNVAIFRCSYSDCSNEVRCEHWSSKLQRHSGFCRRHAHANLDCPFLSTYNHMKDSVTRTNHKRGRVFAFDLSYDEFLFLTQIGVCYYCGESNIQWSDFKGDGNYRYNLDRKDNTKGYTFNNVVVCCKDCNMMKRDWFTADEFKALRLLLKRWREGTHEERQELMYLLSSWNSEIQILL